METPAAAMHVDALPDPLPSGGRVGPYRLLREIGRGGMGTVYLAARDDGEFKHQVAIKLVKRGMDTDRILARFRHERQILAGLDHPNIARLLDGGHTDDGRPYFVMEYVDGESVREYCERRGLTVTDRIALFRTVCAAVQHAHQNLIVHRDIKASNIVVTDAGVPKLLDFGIAKLLDAERTDMGTAATDTVHAMTPEYASPEQIRGEPVTTATDVYSLGVLLYELLAGRRPYETQGHRADEIARAVCDTEPPAPSNTVADRDAGRLTRRLRGDLDTIVLMAMRKDPRRRYGSVEQLSADLGRHLEGRPVTAQRDTFAYRATKFVRRNRAGLAAAAVVFASLAGGLAATTWQARVARGERARAERRFSEVRTLATSFMFELHDAIANLPGSTPARALLVRRALTSLDGLAREAQGDVVLQRELAEAYQKVGDVQGNGYNSNLGDTDGALKSYRKSVELLERVARVDSTSAVVQSDLARSYQKVAEVFTSTGDLQAALRGFDLAVAMQRRLVASYPANVEYRSNLAELYNEIGDTRGQDGYANVGDIPGALASYRESVKVREGIYAESPKDVSARVGLANSLMNLGYLAATSGEVSGVDQVKRAIELFEVIVAENPNDDKRRYGLLSGYARFRQSLADASRFDEAIAMDRKLIAMLGPMIAADSGNMLFQRTLGVGYSYLGRDLRAGGDPRGAIDNHRKGISIGERLALADPKSTEHPNDIAFRRNMLAEALADAHDYGAALDEYGRAAASERVLRVIEPSNTRHADNLAVIYAGWGAVLVDTRNYGGADSAYRQAIPLAEAAVARSGSTQKAKVSLALAYSGAGRLSARRSAAAASSGERASRCVEATAWYRKSLGVWQGLKDKGTLPVVHASKPAEAARAIVTCGATPVH
jgi:non-specific serine/threonine protein kinase/serine/threonine-protein kinase